jgi:probable metal-binding protein
MMNDIHGHEVLKMMLESGVSYSKESLTAEIVARFGPEARFCTCSAQNMTALELVNFLDSKGKFVRRDDGLNTSSELICSDHH